MRGSVTISVLDIFGFENFENNSFEQLCINTANEQLQQYFNQHIFTWELEELAREGIKTGVQVEFVDNSEQVALLLAKPRGIFAVLDEEAKVPVTLLSDAAPDGRPPPPASPRRGARGARPRSRSSLCGRRCRAGHRSASQSRRPTAARVRRATW